MSIEQRRVIDAIGVSKAAGYVILTIADHLPFDGDAAHLLSLQNKINDYLDFIDTGEIYERYPAARGQEIEISVRFKHRPDTVALDFLGRARGLVEELGFRFSYEAPSQPSLPNV